MINENRQISRKMFSNYLISLIDKIFKILPLKENNVDTLCVYLKSLLVELIGSKTLIQELRDDSQFLSLLSIIQYLIDNDSDIQTYKREVFKMIEIVEKLQEKYFEKEVE